MVGGRHRRKGLEVVRRCFASKRLRPFLGGLAVSIAALVGAGCARSQTLALAAGRHSTRQISAIPEHLYMITRGQGPLSLYVFWDPNCSACHLFYEELQQHPRAQRRLTIHWIPVGVIKASSLGKAAAVIHGGWGALQADERGFHPHTESGAINPSQDLKMIAEAKANTHALYALMARHTQNVVATPTFWDPQTHWVRLGDPPSIRLLLHSLELSQHNMRVSRLKSRLGQ